ncbi:MAG: response regulator [Cyanobacteriota bacterium]|nr:response regulator [Cyanobacteriota bacterium]
MMKAISVSTGNAQLLSDLNDSSPRDFRPLSPLDDLHTTLIRYGQQHFTGRLDLEISSGQQWSLYLSLGRLIWAFGGEHPTRRWRRQISAAVAGISQQALTAVERTARFECWDYHLLAVCVYQKLIPTSYAVTFIRNTVTEVLFDIVQAIDFEAIARSAFQTTESLLHNPICVKAHPGVRPSTSKIGILPRPWTVEIDLAWNASQHQWNSWSKLGLGNYSPNLAPILVEPEKVKQQMSGDAYAHFAALINGKRTLRDLAALMQYDLLSLARLLLPHLQQRTIVLVEIPDISLLSIFQVPSPPATQPPPCSLSPSGARPLVACIDDCSRICDAIDSTLSAAGYEVCCIQDAIQAVPILLERKPDYILLDLTMPIVNGYEICSQIRRAAVLKDIPVIILTGHDGLLDRVRAKVVGATDFLSKPIERQKILRSLQKHGQQLKIKN